VHQSAFAAQIVRVERTSTANVQYIDRMNENAPTKVYPEQETPPRPTYSATIRGIELTGWLYYLTDGLMITIKVRRGNNVESHDAQFNPDDPKARWKAKSLWRTACHQLLEAV
jgi:hypothetical protein